MVYLILLKGLFVPLVAGIGYISLCTVSQKGPRISKRIWDTTIALGYSPELDGKNL